MPRKKPMVPEDKIFFAPPPPDVLGAIPAPTPRPGRFPWERMFGPPEPVARPAPAPARPTIAPRPTGAPAWVRPSVDPAQVLDLQAFFNYVRDLRKQPGWRTPAAVPLHSIMGPIRDPVQAALQAGRFFRIPESQILPHGQNAWQYVIEPFIREFERALNLAKPAEFPGTFRLDFANDGSLILGYHEQQP